MADAFDIALQQQYDQNPNPIIAKNPYKDPFEQAANTPENKEKYQEGWGRWAARTALQVPQGLAEGTKAGIGASLFQLLALGESELDPEEWNKLRGMYAEKGIDFDEAYERGREEMLQSIPTVHNIGRKIEQETGIPLEAKTGLQKGTRLSSTAYKLIGNDPMSFIGLQTALPKAALAGGVGTTSQALQKMGLPETVSDLLSFAILKKLPEGSPSVSIGGKTKDSGMPKRGFENLEKPREVSEGKIAKINKKLESDFKEVSSKIIEDSPVGETAKKIAKNPAFKQETQELFTQVQEIADTIKETIPTKSMKKSVVDRSVKEIKGFAKSEYDKTYQKYMNEAAKGFEGENITASQLVEQYRKNNRSLDEFYEPGASKALNRAKKDALLDQNRVIAEMMEEHYPNTELPKVFKKGNDRWTKIMDAEMIDEFTKTIFEKGVNYKKMKDFFDKNGYGQKFKRALGDEGYKAFETLIKDMLSSEAPYKMLKVAENKGLMPFVKNATSFMIHPTLGKVKYGLDAAKMGIRTIMNASLDKPQLAIIWKDGVEALKKGDFKKAETKFQKLTEVVESKKTEALKDFKEHQANKPVENVKETPIETQKPKSVEPKSKELDVPKEKVKVEVEKQKEISKNNKEDAEFRDRFNNAPKGNDQRSYDADKLKKSPAKSLTKEKVKAETIDEPKADFKEKQAEQKQILRKDKEANLDRPRRADYDSEEAFEKDFNPWFEKHWESKEDKIWKKLTSNKEKPQPKKSVKKPKKSISKDDIKVKVYEKEIKKIDKELSQIEHNLRYRAEPENWSKSRIEGEKVDRMITQKKRSVVAKKLDDIKNPKITESLPSTLTEEKIYEIKKLDITPKGLKNQKEFILDKLKDALENPDKYKGQEKILLDVPGDGEFKIYNNEKALKQFMKDIEKRYPKSAKMPMKSPIQQTKLRFRKE